ncbi:hypothetical protein DAPPUDRAFT_246546 [Daphnia pulex]|uniref:Uncharacterized protein n=1 Tax=Daphnia pulex TaxID=6669 RepID=E9GQT9_DAPPU|nr:hypothetical protein DAPPUDRAFT_246546 [Daphnia pulex]|eukprot:EFX78273.1 hypothetical protein DAPPUDRAFT_246546 [Daphnia pulex]
MVGHKLKCSAFSVESMYQIEDFALKCIKWSDIVPSSENEHKKLNDHAGIKANEGKPAGCLLCKSKKNQVDWYLQTALSSNTSPSEIDIPLSVQAVSTPSKEQGKNKT